MSRLKAAVIGLGVGRRHVAGFRAHPRCEVVAVCDLSEDALAATKAEFPGIRKLTRNPRDILTDPAIDLVSIATYDDCHFEQTAEALRHGKHVFVEKPLCQSHEQAAALRELCRARPRQYLSSNLILRMCPRFRWLRDQIRLDRFGPISYIDADYNYGRLHKITDGWRGSIPFYSVVHGGAVHLIDLARWLLQDEVSAVSACGNRIASAGTQFRFNDLTACLLRFNGGALAKVTSNYGCVMPHFHQVSVYGTKATFINGLDEARLFESRESGNRGAAVTAAYPGVDKSELAFDFVESVTCGSAPEVTADDVFATMAVCISVEQAASRNDWVTVNYF